MNAKEIDANSTGNSKSDVENDIHVVTENGEQCFMWRSNQLTYIAQDRQELPKILATKFGSIATKLDLSYNTLISFRNINLFVNLSELILDNNSLEDDQLDFRLNLRLKTLSLNKNKLKDLCKLISSIKLCFPNLEFLSLIENPLCPSSAPISLDVADRKDGDEIALCRYLYEDQTDCDQQKYRHFIIYHLPNLRFLDSSPVSEQERDSALRRCYWMKPLETSSPVNSPVGEGNSNNTPTATTTTTATLPPQTTNTNNNTTIIQQQQANEYSSATPSSSVAYEAAPEGFQMTIMSDYSPTNSSSSNNNDNNYNNNNNHGSQLPSNELRDSDPASEACEVQPRGAFTRLSYKYTGKNSEGNRFIKNQDL